MPPENLNDYIPIRRIAGDATRNTPKSDKVALIFSGGAYASTNHPRYWNDLAFMYKTLKANGYDDDQICVSYANGTHPGTEDMDGDGKDDIDFPATREGLDKAFNFVSEKLIDSGKMFVFTTNHGGGRDGSKDATLYLWQSVITDKVFANKISKVKCGSAIIMMEQCYSGGMLDDLSTVFLNSTASAYLCSAANLELSWSADTEGPYDEYSYHWTSAVAGKTPTGAVVNADRDGDGIVSVVEAHFYARKMDSADESPQHESIRQGAKLTVK